MLARALVLLLIIVSGCNSKPRDEYSLVVGAIAGPESQLVEVAAQIAKKEFGLKIKIVTFEDYLLPNTALSEGIVDINAYQHKPFLDTTRETRGYDLISVGRTFLFPIGIYKGKLKNGPPLIAIPQDPSNKERAIELLNKHNVKGRVIEMDAAMVPHALADVHYAVINTSFADGHALPSAIYTESKDSPYANLLVVREQDENLAKINAFVCAFQSVAVKEKAKQLFGDLAIAAWKNDCDIPSNVKMFKEQTPKAVHD